MTGHQDSAYEDRIYITDLDIIPSRTVIRVGTKLYERVTVAGRTMPARDFYEDWRELETRRGSACQQIDQSLRRGAAVRVMRPKKITRQDLRGDHHD